MEAAIAICESEGVRAAWRLFHHALSHSTPAVVVNARLVLDEAIAVADDEQLNQAIRRYDLSLSREAG